MSEENNGELHNQKDVNPGSELDKLVKEQGDGQLPLTNGTGANNPVPREESLIIVDNSEASVDDSEGEEDDLEEDET